MNTQELPHQILRFSNPHIAFRLLKFYREKNLLTQQEFDLYEMQFLLKTRFFNQIEAKALSLKKPVNIDALKSIDEAQTNYEGPVQTLINFILGSDEILQIEKRHANDNYQRQYRYAKANEITRVIDNKCKIDIKLNKGYLVTILKHAKILFDQANYEQSLRIINSIHEIIEDDQQLSLQWGKLYSEIMDNKFEEAINTIKGLDETIERSHKLQGKSQPLIYNKSLLIHAALYVYFTQPNEALIENFIDFVTSQVNSTVFKFEPHKGMLTTVQNVAPHIVRYISAYQFMNKQYQLYGNFHVQKLQKMLREAVEYQDSLTRYICSVLIDFDFEESKKQLALIKQECQQDFFLNKYADKIYQGAQEFFFEHYCKIFSKISLKDISSYLNINVEQSEEWVVNQLRQSNVKAKIDDKEGTLEILQNQYNYNDNINHRLRDLLPKTNLLHGNIVRALQQQGLQI